MQFSLDYFRHRLNPHIAIDCGSSMTRIQFCPARGKVIEEPTVLVLDRKQKKIISFGKDAQQLEGKIANDIVVIHPISRGRITDAAALSLFLRKLFEQVLGKYFLFQPTVIASIPTWSSPVERSVWERVLMGLGVRQIYLVDQSLASAIGAGVPVAQGSGNITVHLGSEVSEVSLISLGQVVRNKSIKLGSSMIDEEILRIFRQKYGVLISKSTAEYLKKQFNFLSSTNSDQKVMVSGQDIRDARPREIEVQRNLVSASMQGYIQKLSNLIIDMLETIPAELAPDVIDKGFLLTGGGARLNGIDRQLLNLLQVPVSIAESPDSCVITGIQVIFEHLQEYKELVLMRNSGFN